MSCPCIAQKENPMGTTTTTAFGRRKKKRKKDISRYRDSIWQKEKTKLLNYAPSTVRENANRPPRRKVHAFSGKAFNNFLNALCLHFGFNKAMGPVILNGKTGIRWLWLTMSDRRSQAGSSTSKVYRRARDARIHIGALTTR